MKEAYAESVLHTEHLLLATANLTCGPTSVVRPLDTCCIARVRAAKNGGYWIGTLQNFVATRVRTLRRILRCYAGELSAICDLRNEGRPIMDIVASKYRL